MDSWQDIVWHKATFYRLHMDSGAIIMPGYLEKNLLFALKHKQAYKMSNENDTDFIREINSNIITASQRTEKSSDVIAIMRRL